MKKWSFQVDAQGRAKGLPFHFPYSLGDFGNDVDEFSRTVSQYAAEFDRIQATLLPGFPHPMQFEGGAENPQFKTMQRINENAAALEVFKHRNTPTPRPQDFPVGLRVLKEGTEADKSHFREVASLQKVAQDQFEKATHAESVGNFQKAREFRDRALTFQREVDRQRKEFGDYSFVAEEKKRDLEFGKKNAEEFLELDPKVIEENQAEIEAILQGLRDQSDGEESYFVDNASPILGAETSGRVVKVSHPGTRAKDLANVSGRYSGPELLDWLKKTGSQVFKHEEPTEEDREREVSEALRDKSDPEQMSQKEFEAYRQEQGARKL